MTILTGAPYTFTVKVLQRDSYLPQNVAGLDTANSSFTLTALRTLTRVPGNAVFSVENAAEGKIRVSVPSSITNGLLHLRGEAVDNYYPKPAYQGELTLLFTDGNATRSVVVGDIRVVPKGSY